MARTVDRISGGRVVLGIGAGWNRRDYAEYGYEFDTMGGRIQAMGAAIPEIQGRLGALNPPPVRRLPLLIAGTGERRTLKLVAQYADAWHAAFPDRPEELESAVAALRRWCDEVGRDPADIEWGVGVEPEDIERFLARDAAVYVEMGFSQFTLGFNGPSWPVDGGVPFLRWRDQQNARLLAPTAS
jgi:alkanesulfonate monooxygenase SsuD/methylene tetrahydromethanopterin reductase-like flavin-dependent oxidoreductase (luciferase family)